MKLTEILSESAQFTAAGVLENAIEEFVKNGKITGLRDYGSETEEDMHEEVYVMQYNAVSGYIDNYAEEYGMRVNGSLLHKFKRGASIIVLSGDNTDSYLHNGIDNENAVSDMFNHIAGVMEQNLGAPVAEDEFGIGAVVFKDDIAAFWEYIELTNDTGTERAAVLSMGKLK